jgi:hypothetical protein
VIQALDIFLQPGPVFVAQKDKPTFILPFALIAVTTIALMMSYFFSVDPDWYMDYMLSASGTEMSAVEMEQAAKMMPGARTMAYISAATATIGIGLGMLLYAVYFFVAGKLTGHALGFKSGLSLATWSSMPTVIGTLVALVGVFLMTPQTSLESLMLLNVDPLLVELPRDHRWSALAKGFSLLAFWTIFLGALGWKIWGRTSWLQAIVVAVLPSLVICGGMALFALLK